MHIFPFDKVDKNEQILIYGAGIIGQEFAAEIVKTSYCSILALVDRNAGNIKNTAFEVIFPENIKDYIFDRIVIALESDKNIEDVEKMLLHLGVPGKKIVKSPNSNIKESTSEPFGVNEIKDNVLHIAINQSFGLGDAMMDILFVNALKQMLGTGCRIDYICKYGELYEENPLFDRILKEADSEERYDLYIESKHIAIIVYWAKEKVRRISEELYRFCLHSIELQAQYMGRPVKMFELYAKAKLFNRTRIEEIDMYKDLKISRYDRPVFSLNVSEAEVLEKFGLDNRNYIVVNRDVDADGNISHPKLWSSEKYEETVTLIKKEFPNLIIVQLGAGREETFLKNADRNLSGKTTISEMKVLLKNAVILLSSEGGLVHVMHFLNGKSAVIFGPTDEQHFGYEDDFVFVNRSCGIPCNYIDRDWNKNCIAGCGKRSCVEFVEPKTVVDTIAPFIRSKSRINLQNYI